MASLLLPYGPGRTTESREGVRLTSGKSGGGVVVDTCRSV